MHSGQLALPVPERTTGIYREYSSGSQQRVELIQRALTIGFSLSELRTILRANQESGVPARRTEPIVEGLGQAVAADKTGSNSAVAGG